MPARYHPGGPTPRRGHIGVFTILVSTSLSSMAGIGLSPLGGLADRSTLGDYSGVIRLWERIGLAAGSIPVRLTTI